MPQNYKYLGIHHSYSARAKWYLTSKLTDKSPNEEHQFADYTCQLVIKHVIMSELRDVGCKNKTSQLSVMAIH